MYEDGAGDGDYPFQDIPDLADSTSTTPTFNPLKYNLPTRLFSNSPNSPFHLAVSSSPTADHIHTYLRDIERSGREYGMSDEEMLGMAFYYADDATASLWRDMIYEQDNKIWSKFRPNLMWLYPDAFFHPEVYKQLRVHTPPPLAYGASPLKAREYIAACLRIIHDGFYRSSRQLCIKFADGLPVERALEMAQWKGSLAKCVGKKYPALKDEFDLEPVTFLFHIFWVWRVEWLVQKETWVKSIGFYIHERRGIFMNFR